MRQRPFEPLVRLGGSQGSRLEQALAAWDSRWTFLLESRFDPAQTRVLRPLLLGDRSPLKGPLREALIQTGAFHLMVISGFHIGLIALLLNSLGRLLAVPRPARLALVAMALGAFCLFVGARPPVLRATVMAWMVLAACACGRTIHWPNLAAGAALLILLFDPVQIFDPGFQLSFGAVASLLLFARGLTRWLLHRLAWVRPLWLRGYLAVNLGCTVAIEVGLWPVLAWYYYLFTPVALLSNLLLVPLVSLLVALGIFGLTAAVLWTQGLALLAPVLTGCITAVEFIALKAASIPGGWWVAGRPPAWIVAGYYGLLAASLLRLRLRRPRFGTMALWLAGISLWCLSARVQRIHASNALIVDILDVGHGDCLVAHPPKGGIWIMDGGTEAAGRRIVVPFLRYSGVRSIDAVWITHPDEDHAGGIIPVLESFPVRRILTNGSRDDTMAFQRLMAIAKEKQISVSALSAGPLDSAAWGMQVEVLHPPDGFVPGTDPSQNENSMVVRMLYQQTSLLSAGDIDGEGVPDLLGRFSELQSTVLKVPHHGSALGSFGPEFFNAVDPEVAVVSVGQKHGLPAEETLRSLESAGAEVWMTRESGSIRLRLDGKQVHVIKLSR